MAFEAIKATLPDFDAPENLNNRVAVVSDLRRMGLIGEGAVTDAEIKEAIAEEIAARVAVEIDGAAYIGRTNAEIAAILLASVDGNAPRWTSCIVGIPFAPPIATEAMIAEIVA